MLKVSFGIFPIGIKVTLRPIFQFEGNLRSSQLKIDYFDINHGFAHLFIIAINRFDLNENSLQNCNNML